MKISRSFRSAFTFWDLIIVISVIVVLACFLLPRAPHGRVNPLRLRCVNNLKHIGLAYCIYANDHNDLFPWESGKSNAPAADHALGDLLNYTLLVSNELSAPFIVSCPADQRPPPTNWSGLVSVKQISYFLGMDSSPNLSNPIAAGDRNLTNSRGSLALGVRKIGVDHTIGWDATIHKSQGNILMGDGSVQQVSPARLRSQIQAALENTNSAMTWIIP
jgi:prepilin-type processing-associated H-X9-DG protein